MANINIDKNKCTDCGICQRVCPFDAIANDGGQLIIGVACKMCKICIKECPYSAMSLEEDEKEIDKSLWQGYLVFVEYVENKIHPVAYELIGAAHELSRQRPMPVYVVIIGKSLEKPSGKLLGYGVDKVFAYDDEKLAEFKVDSYTNVLENIIKKVKPSVVLVGGTSIGRSLAPRVATRLKTGLTADCTTLKIKENTDLVQIRPAFGGNIMAQIITPYTRPQFATVRYKVMDTALKVQPFGEILYMQVDEHLTKSDIEVLKIAKKEAVPSITEAEVLVVAGNGLQAKEDLDVIKQLAKALNGEYACTRPLVEKGWCDYTRQIGLSGRTVKPKLIITCGVSGAIQFAACMNCSEYIISINTDKNAPITEIAHVGIVGNLYAILPQLIQTIKGANKNEV